MQPNQLVQEFQKLGYTASWSPDDGEVVNFTAAGCFCHVVPYPPADLQFAVGFEKRDQPIKLEFTNQLNLHYRFAKLAVDSDGDLLVLMDIALARVDGDSLAGLLQDCLATWVEVVTSVIDSFTNSYPK